MMQPIEIRRTVRTIDSRRLRAWAIAAGVTLLGGCSLAHRTFEPARNPDALDDLSFLHYLATVPVVTIDEGTRAVLLLLTDDAIDAHTFADRRDVLIRRGALRPAWDVQPQRMLDYGTLAYMLHAVCEMKPSVGDRLSALTGLGDRRAALRSCIHEGVIPYNVPHAPVSGGALVSAISAAERYIDRS